MRCGCAALGCAALGRAVLLWAAWAGPGWARLGWLTGRWAGLGWWGTPGSVLGATASGAARQRPAPHTVRAHLPFAGHHLGAAC